MKPTKKQTIRNLIKGAALLELDGKGVEFSVHVDTLKSIYTALFYLGLSEDDIRDKIDLECDKLIKDVAHKGVF